MEVPDVEAVGADERDVTVVALLLYSLRDLMVAEELSLESSSRTFTLLSSLISLDAARVLRISLRDWTTFKYTTMRQEARSL